ncbi:MAG: Fe-S cluster assembly protein SufD [Candidatus Tectomicrobia bacterium]|uniref:Fe-S cluster assembly protein SufD n=1 Tax=Tectimicrobiota bacterium TaxID=2528274 RepID=A0A933LRI4_UNCTE|nr:Fe-S cluster assembly protein SufD [Candidatus Tectomicrobia bacterium]
MAVMEELALSKSAVEDALECRSEPAWMREKRFQAWRFYETIPMPSGQEEEWRRTSLQNLKIRDITPLYLFPSGLKADVSEVQPASGFLRDIMARNGDEQKPVLLQQNGQTVYCFLPSAWKDKGVILLPLERAVNEYPDLVVNHFMKEGLRIKDDKFLALHGAFWAGGVFFYVPPKLNLDVPVEMYSYLDQAGAGSFPHNLIILDAGSQASFTEYYLSSAISGQIFHNGGDEVYLYPNAKLSYSTLQDWQDNLYNVSNFKVLMKRDSILDWMMGLTGSQISKAHYETVLQGEGADCQMHGMIFGTKRDHLDVFTLMEHVSPHTTANLFYKGVVRDRARAVFQGLIKIRKEASQTDSYLANKNLVLSNKARIDTMPRLEIDNNDVKASHGAAVGYVEDSELFYLMSRGIPRQDAERMMVDAFLGPLFNRISSERAREFWRSSINARLAN